MNLNEIFTLAFFITFLTAGVRLAIPVLLAALGEILNELAGTMNVGIEGLMLIGDWPDFLALTIPKAHWLVW